MGAVDLVINWEKYVRHLNVGENQDMVETKGISNLS